jgi:hypothetical protein
LLGLDPRHVERVVQELNSSLIAVAPNRHAADRIKKLSAGLERLTHLKTSQSALGDCLMV